MDRFKSLLAAAILGFGIAAPADAGVILVNFSGAITGGTDTSGYFTGTEGTDLSNPGGVGSPPAITGSFSYDTDTYPPDGSGFYGGDTPFLSFTIKIAGNSYTFGSLASLSQGAYVVDDPAADDFGLFLVGGDESSSELVSFDLLGGDFLDGTDLPLSFTYQRAVGGTAYFVFQNGPDIADLAVSVTCASTDIDCAAGTDSPVPEPSAWALLIAGFGLVGAMLRRRRPDRRCASA